MFTEIVKDMNLCVTAERLLTTQQGLSGHIKRLENHFGVSFFERNPKLVLTKEGKVLLREAKEILEIERKLFANFGTGPQAVSGMLRVSCGLARSRYYMPKLISEFASAYPSVKVHLIDENNFRNKHVFSDNTVDIHIGRALPPLPGVKSIHLIDIGGVILISDALLRKYTGASADRLIETAVNGVEISEFPSEIPIAYTGIAKFEPWFFEKIPELRRNPRIFVDPENYDLQLSLCREGKVMLLVSEMHIQYIRQTFAPGFYENIHMFPHYLHGKKFSLKETLSYDSNRFRPQYVDDFIKITLSVYSRMNLNL